MFVIVDLVDELKTWICTTICRSMIILQGGSCGKKLKVSGLVRIRGCIIIGDNVTINSCHRRNPIGGNTFTSLYACRGATIKIGNNVGMSNSALFSKIEIAIGEYVKIGGNVKIYDTDFHSMDYLNRRDRQTDIPESSPVSVGDDAFIGAHSVILKGNVIGKRSIVGACSVVTKSIPADEIWAGNPAKCIRKQG